MAFLCLVSPNACANMWPSMHGNARHTFSCSHIEQFYYYPYLCTNVGQFTHTTFIFHNIIVDLNYINGQWSHFLSEFTL